ncbi:hypothetical protein [Pseudochrobactrum sp. MP213Fo]|uniref:hypothetical protein n=1 Tax=Pseudochrobactrum sp. MP213Fo TaxID=3022250 RepID=UPI003BA05886
MSVSKDQEQVSYTAEPTTVNLSVIIETYKALLTGDNLPERVAVQTLVLQTFVNAAENKQSNREKILALIAELLVQWDKDYPVNCHNGYAGLKELGLIIADAVTILSAGRSTEA